MIPAFFPHGGLAASVLAMFANGEQGAWYDPSDLSTLFQDAAGTIPVTAAGQPVGLMMDKSGRGNHARQTTVAKRPVLTLADGKYSLYFDGADDAMFTDSINFTGTDKMTVVAGVRKLRDATALLLELSINSGQNNGTFYVTAPENATAKQYASIARASASPSVAQAASTNTGIGAAPDVAVLTAQHDLSGDLSRIQRNGISGINGTADKGVGNFGNYPIFVGARAGTSFYFQGHIYGLIVRGAQSSAAQIAAAESYANVKTGAY